MYCIDVLFHTMITLTFKSYTDNTVCLMHFHLVANTHIWHFSNDCAVEGKINVFISILSNLIIIKIVLAALSSMNFMKVYALFFSLPVCSGLYCMTNELIWWTERNLYERHEQEKHLVDMQVATWLL